MPSVKVTLMYDFDRTLCTRDMQEYGFIPGLGMQPAQFWSEVSRQSADSEMDPILSYMYTMVLKSREKKKPITRASLMNMGKDIELFPGVTQWFRRINDYGSAIGLEVEHYVISSGLKEIIEGTSIAEQFSAVYASEFHYDKSGQADWPSMAVNFTNKTQFLFRIHKGALTISDERINEEIPQSDIYVPYNHMIYIGDGMTDVPCMSLVKRYGGYSIAVFAENYDAARKLSQQNRVNFAVPADYSSGTPLDMVIKRILSRISLDNELETLRRREEKVLNH